MKLIKNIFQLQVCLKKIVKVNSDVEKVLVTLCILTSLSTAPAKMAWRPILLFLAISTMKIVKTDKFDEKWIDFLKG